MSSGSKDRNRGTQSPEKEYVYEGDSPLESAKMRRFNFKIIAWSIAVDVIIKVIHQLYITGVWDYHNIAFDHSVLALSYLMDVIVFMVIFNTSVSDKR